MDYEQKYKEALQKIRELIEIGKKKRWTIISYEKDFEEIFPELAESEDEKIRKALLNLVHDTTGDELWDNYDVRKEKALAWLEKQGEQIFAKSAKTCKDEQKSTDKVEPKFHEGEWLQYRNAKPFFVEEITKQGYVNGDSCLPFNWENEIHLWTIQDAKDGDVLASNSSVFIFKEEYIAEKPIAHCGIMNGRFIKGKDVCWTNQRYYPATKEQRDLLFQKIKEAGYEWNSEKKELKKIPNALEEREIVHIEHGKCYYCIKDYYAGGNKRASKGDVVMALNGMSMMDLGVKANEYFIPVNNIELKPAAWSEEDEENMNNALYILNQLKDTSSYEDDIAEKIIVWLKSLKQRIGG